MTSLPSEESKPLRRVVFIRDEAAYKCFVCWRELDWGSTQSKRSAALCEVSEVSGSGSVETASICRGCDEVLKAIQSGPGYGEFTQPADGGLTEIDYGSQAVRCRWDKDWITQKLKVYRFSSTNFFLEIGSNLVVDSGRRVVKFKGKTRLWSNDHGTVTAAGFVVAGDVDSNASVLLQVIHDDQVNGAKLIIGNIPEGQLEFSARCVAKSSHEISPSVVSERKCSCAGCGASDITEGDAPEEEGKAGDGCDCGC